MRIKKFIELTCAKCGKKFLKEQKEYKRQSKKGKNLFYCNLSCSSRACESFMKNAEFYKNNPSLIGERMKQFKIKNPTSRFSNDLDHLSPFRYYLRKIKQRLKSKLIKNKILECKLSVLQIEEIWEFQGGKCPYTGIGMKLVTPKNKTSPYQASLDRIDSSKGYTRDNVEFVCLAVNYAKNNFTKEQIIEFFKELKQ